MTHAPALLAVHAGHAPYADTVRFQESLVALRREDRIPDLVLFADHPPVLTVGRQPSEGSLIATPEALAARGIEVHHVARGGDVTWHGPGQLVGYPIVDLAARGRDLHRFLRSLEEALIASLRGWGVEGRRVAGRTGVWAGDAKIASIGIAVRRWVSYHGFALNVSPDLGDFSLIHPCGLHGISMTSLEALLGGRAPSMEEARQAVAGSLARTLGFRGVEWSSVEALRAECDEPGRSRRVPWEAA